MEHWIDPFYWMTMDLQVHRLDDTKLLLVSWFYDIPLYCAGIKYHLFHIHKVHVVLIAVVLKWLWNLELVKLIKIFYVFLKHFWNSIPTKSIMQLIIWRHIFVLPYFSCFQRTCTPPSMSSEMNISKKSFLQRWQMVFLK